MVDFNVHIGFIQDKNNLDGKPYKPFVLDLSKFPSLFIDYNYKVDSGMDTIMKRIRDRCIIYSPQDRVKCVVIDEFGIEYNSIMQPGTYRHDKPETMMKRLDTYVSKIYEEYLKNPDNFIPRTRYIIAVCRIGGMEKQLISIMSKLGAIGVYLIMADDASGYADCPDLFANLYGKLTYADLCSAECDSMLEYDPYENAYLYQDPEFVCVLDRFRLQPKKYDIIYPLHYRKDFSNVPSPIKTKWRIGYKNDLPTRICDSIF